MRFAGAAACRPRRRGRRQHIIDHDRSAASRRPRQRHVDVAARRARAAGEPGEVEQINHRARVCVAAVDDEHVAAQRRRRRRFALVAGGGRRARDRAPSRPSARAARRRQRARICVVKRGAACLNNEREGRGGAAVFLPPRRRPMRCARRDRTRSRASRLPQPDQRAVPRVEAGLADLVHPRQPRGAAYHAIWRWLLYTPPLIGAAHAPRERVVRREQH